ncbi:MAG: hypothetical protein ACR2NX_11965 [Chthoniobacterales bacterium]
MNRRRAFAAWLLVFCSVSLLAGNAGGQEEIGQRVRAAFWNIKWFPGGRPKAYQGEEVRQIRAVQTDIVRLAADVIGFEEVRDWKSAAIAR